MARPPQRTYQRLLPPAMGFYRTATGSLPRQNRAVRESGSRLERRQAPREEKLHVHPSAHLQQLQPLDPHGARRRAGRSGGGPDGRADLVERRAPRPPPLSRGGPLARPGAAAARTRSASRAAPLARRRSSASSRPPPARATSSRSASTTPIDGAASSG